jgi:hypothetical protein
MNKLRERVVRSAEAVLKREKSVGPLEVLQAMGLLSPVHVEYWRKGHEAYPTLESWIQGSEEKLDKTFQYFAEWVRGRGLRPVQAEYRRIGPRGAQPLQITEDGDPGTESFFRMHYAPADLPARKADALKKKLEKAPDLVVFELVSDLSVCGECGAEIHRGGHLCMEKGQPLCLQCADLDHLVYLPSGDAALSRRARVKSPLAAVVVRFSRARKRYERQGILVTPQALAAAEDECADDAGERALRRERQAARRQAEDREFVEAFSQAILARYPRCGADEARRIAEHAAQRGSGRIGRSNAGRELEPKAIDLAVAASIRHNHTKYDELLMRGVDRETARQQVRAQIEEKLEGWLS